MVVKKNKKNKKVIKKVEEEKEEHEGGASLDDAFGDDEDVEYAPTKVKKKKKIDEDEEELEEELDEIQAEVNVEPRGEIQIKASKPITKVKKGDRVFIDGTTYEVDAHEMLIDHGTTKEMAIEIFNPKTDRDYQLRYFSDQAESTLDLYELQEIIYVRKSFKKVEW